MDFSYIVFIGCLFLIRPLTVLFHELGHAFSALLLTKERTSVFIGSFGNENNSIKIPIVRIDFYIYKNPFKWGYGLCISKEKNMSVNNRMLYTAAGPLASLFIALISYLIISKAVFWNEFFFLLLISSVLDFLANIFPSDKNIQLADGRKTSNDGKTLMLLLKIKNLPKEYNDGIHLFNAKEFDSAAGLFEKALIKNKHEQIFRMAIISHLQNKNYEKGKEISEKFKKLYPMNSDDMANYGLCYTNLGLLSESLEIYDKSLHKNSKNKFSLNNKGYTLILLERYDEAIQVLDKAISVDKQFSYSYNNRGLAKLKINLLEEGWQDVKTSLEIDPENSHAYKNLGIYYFEKQEYSKALELFKKAKKIDEDTDEINELINHANLMLT